MGEIKEVSTFTSLSSRAAQYACSLFLAMHCRNMGPVLEVTETDSTGRSSEPRKKAAGTRLFLY